MCPEILSMPSYSVLIAIGIIAGILAFRLLCDKKKMADEVYRFYSILIIISVAIGFLGAMLFQSVYNFLETGYFELRGLTFMGGLIGGAGCFISITLLNKNIKIRSCLLPILEIATPCLVLAHAFGRIGCFLSGCCHGIESESGLYFPTLNKTVIPTNLYEAVFLFVLFAILFIFALKDKPQGFNLSLYCIFYGVFRFTIEFFRGDERGSFIPGISPSQFWSIALIIVGFVLIVLRKFKPQAFNAKILQSQTE